MPLRSSSSPRVARVLSSRENSSTLSRSTRGWRRARATSASAAAAQAARGTASPKRSTRNRRKPGSARLAAAYTPNAATQSPSVPRSATSCEETPRRTRAHPAR